MAAHKWHKEICAWAEGKEIQYNSRGMWEDFDSQYDPNWKSETIEWRIKPAEPEREYPQTQMTGDELDVIYMDTPAGDLNEDFIAVANAALRHACDNGQIVTRAEFDRAVGDRQKRDKAIALAVGEYVGKTVAANIAAGLDSSSIDLFPIIAAVK
jgi:hypothetical protein